MAKESAEKLQELHIDRLSHSKDEKERIKRERKAENEVMMRGLKGTLKLEHLEAPLQKIRNSLLFSKQERKE